MWFFSTKMVIGRVLNDSDKDKNQTYDSYEPYIEEHNRLGALKDESENIWEERTYQLCTGGLSLTFAVFSFLMSMENGISFHWQMAAIWGGYVFCLVLNYLSHRVAICKFKNLQEQLDKDRLAGAEYDEEKLAKRNSKSDCLINFMNIITEVVLVVDIIFTIIYTSILFCSK